MADRVKGQNTFISVIRDGDLESRLDTITNCEVVFEMETSAEGYLGRVADLYDATFSGMTIKFEGHMASRAAFDITDSVVNKAKQRAGGAFRIDVATTFVFPNGDLVDVSIPDVHFESMPYSSGGRTEFVSFSWEAKASDYELT